MKKFLFFLLLSALFHTTYAQVRHYKNNVIKPKNTQDAEIFKLAVNAGGTVSWINNAIGSAGKGAVKEEKLIRPFGGILGEYKFTDEVGLRVGVLYTMKGNTVVKKDSKDPNLAQMPDKLETTINYIQIPILLRIYP